MKKTLLLFFTAGLFLVATNSFALTIYVAANGSDAGTGAKSHPFATLVRARDEVRRLNQTGALPSQGATILVGTGIYRFSDSLVLGLPDSGTASGPIVWQAEAVGKVHLSGGTPLPTTAFQSVTNLGIRKRLDPSAQDKVLVINLRALGINDLGNVPDSFRGAAPVPELFFNDQRLTLARWPNEGWATVAKVIKRGEHGVPQEGTDQSSGPGRFEYDGNRPDRWNTKMGVWLQGYWAYDWYDEIIKVGEINHDQHEITLAKPARYGVGFGNPAPRRYRAINVLEEMDQLGEYYIDRDTGSLYLWPPGEMASARIELAVFRAPLLVMTNASHITFRDFVLEEGVGDTVGTPPGQIKSVIAARATNSPPDNTSDRVVMQPGGGGSIVIRDGQQIRLESCEIRNMRRLGIRITGGNQCVVVSCNIHDTGTGGLVLEGGDRRELTPGNNEAFNNRFSRCSQNQLTYGNSLTLAGVGNRAAHNEFSDTPHMAIGIIGNDNVFELNYIHDVCTASDDSGALYKGRDPSCRGNIIRYNFWRDIGSTMGHGTAAIYFDDGDGGDSVIGNIFLRCGSPGKGNFGTVFSHGGHDILAENNIFIDSGRALGSVPWHDVKWKQWLASPTWQKRLLHDVDITQSPYTTHYPQLVGFMDAQPEQTRVSYSRNNVFVNCNEVSGGNWTNVPGEIWTTESDPGFVNLAKGDLRLRRHAEVYQHLPNFKPIPFAAIGIESKAQPPAAAR